MRGSFKGVDGWQGSGKGGIRVRVPRGWGSGTVRLERGCGSDKRWKRRGSGTGVGEGSIKGG